VTTTITVGSGKDYSTISAAVSAVPATLDDNYIIEIYAGTYTDQITEDKIYGPIYQTTTTYSLTFEAADGESVVWDVGAQNMLYRYMKYWHTCDVRFKRLDMTAHYIIRNDDSYYGTKFTFDQCAITYNAWIGVLEAGERDGIRLANELTIRNCCVNSPNSTDPGFKMGTGGHRKVRIQNSTFYIRAGLFWLAHESGGSSDVLVENTITIHKASAKIFNIQTITDTNVIFRNNIYYGDGGATLSYEYDDVLQADFAAWKTATGDNSTEEDPKLSDPANGNFTLQVDSPAIDNGYDNSFTEDVIGTARPQGTSIDIGAFEYQDMSPEGGPLLCWTLTGRYENGRSFQITGPDKFPGLNKLKLPKLTDISVVEDGIDLM